MKADVRLARTLPSAEAEPEVECARIPCSPHGDEPSEARPFLKWVGGKRQLLPQLTPLIPPRFGGYIEPFVGGGALFFALRPEQATLGDVNAELVDCYRAIRDDVEEVIAILQTHHYDKDYYYDVRDGLDPSALSPAERAARTIYLNRAGFNGLYRVNQAGQFNVPFGRYTNPTLCDATNLRACSARLRGVDLRHGHYADVASGAKAGDLVYFDPPYVPVSATAKFTGYTAGGFGERDHVQLAELFDTLAQRSVHVLLSNSDTPTVRTLYRAHEIISVSAKRNINAVVSGRGKVGEVIVRGRS